MEGLERVDSGMCVSLYIMWGFIKEGFGVGGVKFFSGFVILGK